MKRFRWAFAGLALMAALQGCGGAQAGGVSAALSGATLGYGNLITRDTSSASGGQPGFVSSGTTVRAVAGKAVTSFEWANLSILDNYAQAGENVASYAQSNKYGSGPTWAAVSEVADFSASNSALVAHEFDVWTSGADTGNRLGVNIVLGDVKQIRGLGKSDVTEATAAIRVDARPGTVWKRGLQLTGDYDIAGVDLASARLKSGVGLRLAEGQSIELAPGVRLQSVNRRVVITRDGIPVLDL